MTEPRREWGAAAAAPLSVATATEAEGAEGVLTTELLLPGAEEKLLLEPVVEYPLASTVCLGLIALIVPEDDLRVELSR